MQGEVNLPTTSTTLVTTPKHPADDCASKAIVQLAPAARSNGPNVIVWPFGVTAPPQLFDTLLAKLSAAGSTSVATTESATVPGLETLIVKRVLSPAQIASG